MAQKTSGIIHITQGSKMAKQEMPGWQRKKIQFNKGMTVRREGMPKVGPIKGYKTTNKKRTKKFNPVQYEAARRSYYGLRGA